MPLEHASPIGAVVPAYKGHRIVLGYELIGAHWYRTSEYHPDDGGKPSIDGQWCCYRTDVSPSHATYPSGYNAACGWCYGGYSHTENEHARQVGL